MNKTIYLIYDGDSYEIEVDTNRLTVLTVWRYASNKARIPEVVPFHKLDDELQQLIDHRLVSSYGEPPTDHNT